MHEGLEKSLAATEQSIYETLGADVGIRRIVDEFYGRVTVDQDLAPYFVDVEMSTLRRHQAAMLAAATGGPDQYSGQDMAAAHAGLNISDEHFDRVVAHLVGTLVDFDVEDETIEQVGEVLAPLRPAVVKE